MISINEVQDEVIAEFNDFDDWMDRYQLLIDLGNEQEPLDEKYKTEQNLIEGCQSRVWLQADEVDGKIIFQAESDALIVKGIISLLIKVLSGHTPDDFDDWMDRYQLLIDLGNEQEPLDEKYKTEQNLIEGCQSRVWLQADEVDGKIIFQAESDALIVKGIISLLIKVLSGHTPDEILNADLYFIDKIGLKEHLSPTRSNGLLSMVKQMRMYALAFKAKGI